MNEQDAELLYTYMEEELAEEEPMVVSSLTGKRVLVTGSKGFFGTHICNELRKVGAEVLETSSGEYDLTNYEHTRACFKTYRPDIVVHVAGFNGGIAYNEKFGADILHKNTMMALNVHKVSAEENVEKLLSVSASCSYPDIEKELYEEVYWNGLPNETVRGHGLAKRFLHACAEQYRKQHGLNAVVAIVTNLFGPGDTFNLERTKVAGAVIRKVVEAHQNGQPDIEFWGTGNPKRQLMYVEDASKALLEVLENYNEVTPINIGCSEEVTIKELVNTVVDKVGYIGTVKWDKTKVDGQMRKYLNLDKMHEYVDIDETPFSKGIANTVEWYINNKKEADSRK